MITLIIIVALLGVLFFMVCAGAMVLLDPIIAILIIVCIGKLAGKVFKKKG